MNNVNQNVEITFDYITDEFELEIVYDDKGYAYSYSMPDVGCEFDPKILTLEV